MITGKPRERSAQPDQRPPDGKGGDGDQGGNGEGNGGNGWSLSFPYTCEKQRRTRSHGNDNKEEAPVQAGAKVLAAGKKVPMLGREEEVWRRGFASSRSKEFP